MNGEAFLAYIEQCLAPTLRRRDIVAIDNVSFHKVAGVQEAIWRYRGVIRPIVHIDRSLAAAVVAGHE